MATIPQELPGKDILEREQLYLANQKLRVDTEKALQDAKPESWWVKFGKNILAFGGVVTVIATLYGIWDSYDKTIDDREKARVLDQRTRFEDAIKRLESSSTISKLVGVSVLSGYLGPADQKLHRQVLFTLAGLMATEKDLQTQAAVLDLMSSTKVESVTPADWRYFQDMLVTQSRALMAKGHLLNHRSFQANLLSDDELAARTVGNLIAMNIRKDAVPDYTDYHGIYCEQCDFHGIIFPKSVDFSDSVLDYANFNGATLEAALFDNAELMGTIFVEADLRNAAFRSGDVGNMRTGPARTAYIDHYASTLDTNAFVTVLMPDFSCADLEDVDFDHHALFPSVVTLERTYVKDAEGKIELPSPGKDDLLPRVTMRPFFIIPTKFFKSDIKNAKLDDARFFLSLNQMIFQNTMILLPDWASYFRTFPQIKEP